MKKILLICSVAVLMTSCGIYKPYTRPEMKTNGLYGNAESADTATIGNIAWQEMFTDPNLQALIEQGLANNTDLQSAQWRVKEAEATLKTARLAFLPSFNVAPQGVVSRFDDYKANWTYNVPITASWELDIFSRLRNSKRRAKALYAQSKEYEQAVKTQVISGIANMYYTLLTLDNQYAVSKQTAAKWRESVETMRAMKQAGMTNEAAVSQTAANCYSIEASLCDLEYQIREVENSLASVLG
ncbi:MAG: TolC family protein, partial [Alistipes sp.]